MTQLAQGKAFLTYFFLLAYSVCYSPSKMYCVCKISTPQASMSESAVMWALIPCSVKLHDRVCNGVAFNTHHSFLGLVLNFEILWNKETSNMAKQQIDR
jgi:hypothetical protein